MSARLRFVVLGLLISMGAGCSAGSDVCREAAEHVAACLGTDPAPAPDCDPGAAEQLLETPCGALGLGGDDRADSFDDRVAESLCDLGVLRYCPAPVCATTASLPPSASCGELIDVDDCGSCAYYACREERADPGCGPNGYFIEYGQRYCELLLLTAGSRLSSEGREWMQDTRRCLMRYIDGNVGDDVGEGDSCDGLRQEAFESHVDCYIDNGFCELPITDWLLLFGALEPKDRDLGVVLTTGVSCLEHAKDRLLDIAGKR